MKPKERRFDFTLDMDRLTEMVLAAHRAFVAEEGLFEGGGRRFLPQWNLPEALEHSPRKDKPANCLAAANYLWACAFFERINQSRVIIRNANRVWLDPRKKNIFDPSMVRGMGYEDVREILEEDFQFALQSRGESPPAERFKDNAELLVRLYGADPRNLIRYNTVEQARANMMEFQGIGTGIANLYLMWSMERRLAFPRDPENALLKVDVHKGRLPANCNAVEATNHEIPRDERFVDTMEQAYWQVCREKELDAQKVDSALWIIGSEGCARNDYVHCQRVCPLSGLCEANTPENRNTGRYVVRNEKGERLDSRRQRGQGLLFT